jgi:DNA-binding MarR family transcriptional regulator
MTASDETEPIALPAMLRAARGAYVDAIRTRLAGAGMDDLPRNAPYVLGGMANRRRSISDLIRELDVTKQAASQLIDTLVVRGYLSREVDAADRRRLSITLTDRGFAAASAVRAGIADVDAELAERCDADELAALRAALVALNDIRQRRARCRDTD